MVYRKPGLLVPTDCSATHRGVHRVRSLSAAYDTQAHGRTPSDGPGLIHEMLDIAQYRTLCSTLSTACESCLLSSDLVAAPHHYSRAQYLARSDCLLFSALQAYSYSRFYCLCKRKAVALPTEQSSPPMAPRYIERVQSQSDTLQKLYGMPLFDPPPYNRPLHRRSISSSTETSASQSPSEDSTSSSSTCLTSSVCSSTSNLPTYQQAIQQFAQRETPSIPRGSRILVTGASSWHGMHTVDQLLRQGYTVRGTVIDANKALDMTSYFHRRYDSDRFEAVIVPDRTIPGAYNVAARRCSGLVHADNTRMTSANPYDVIPPTIMGALNMLEAAAREPRMRRVVYCSSVLAATNHGGHRPSTITHESWNVAAFCNAWDPSHSRNDRSKDVMASAAMQAEQTVWRWYRAKRPGFVLNCGRCTKG